MIYAVSNLGQYGIIGDLGAHELPPGAWSAGNNVRFQTNYAEKFLGDLEVYQTPLFEPLWLLPVLTNDVVVASFWLYAGAEKVGCVEGVTHADITKLATTYSTDLGVGWTGGILGGIPIINNGTDVPQMWNPVAAAQPLQDLTNWPPTWSCRSLRTFKDFLVAIDVVKGTTRFPNLVAWSQHADPSTVPGSWVASATNDAGERELGQTNDTLLEQTVLRDVNIIYKQNSTWGMQYIGGQEIFRFYQIFSNIGILTRRCVTEFFSGRHLILTGADIVVHDGQQAESILIQKHQKFLLNNISQDNFNRSYVVTSPIKSEVWVCFPDSDHNYPNIAMVWNWKTGQVGIRDLPNAPFIQEGTVNPTIPGEAWDTAVGDWASDAKAWGNGDVTRAQRALLIAAGGKLLASDFTNQFDTVDMTSYLERQGIGVPFATNQPPDITSMKFLRNVWVRISGTTGGVVKVYVGAQMEIGGPVVYQTARDYTIGTTTQIDCRLTGRLFAIKVESTTNIEWKFHGYELDVIRTGSY